MSINMSNVKAITLGGQNVKKIEDSNGKVLWEEPSVVQLDYITISGSYKRKLPTGSAFTFGGTVRAYYTDGTNAVVTSSTTFSGYNMSTAGSYTVTASYTEDGITKTTTYTLTVANTSTATYSVTVGASQYITTTQYFNRIVIPSLSSIKSTIASKTSREVYSVDAVKIAANQLNWCKQGSHPSAVYPFLLTGSTTSSTIVAVGRSYQFPSASSASFSSSDTDITSYVYSSSTRSLYGAYGTTNSTPTTMFSSSTGAYTFHFCMSGNVTTLPTFILKCTYTYFS